MWGDERPSLRDVEQRLDRLLDRVFGFSDAELVMLRAIWDEQDEIPRTLAWQQVKAFVGATGLGGLLDETRATLMSWVGSAGRTVAGASGARLASAGHFVDPTDVRSKAMPPILDAVAATIAQDGLEAADETVLLEPLLRLVPHSTHK
jgi:hypothetical protein